MSLFFHRKKSRDDVNLFFKIFDPMNDTSAANQIADDLYYVGVNDRTSALFEGMWPLPHGISYNAYLLTGPKTALIDTVETCYFDTLLEKIRRIIGERPVDYLVINHMEPDHSGCAALIRKYYPQIRIVASRQALSMLKGFYDLEGDSLAAADDTVVDLGNRRLNFRLTPMVHWPETMMTLETSRNILFSGDAFGTFGALNGGCLDSRIDTALYGDEMVRYYSNIVGRYGPAVQKALGKLAGLPVRMICPTHGPVWHQEKDRVIDLYDRLSRYQASPGITLAYGSMYGHTEAMAETIAEALSALGVRRIAMHNVSTSDASYILSDVFRYQGLILGAPTYNASLYPAMESLVSKLRNREICNRFLGCFGSFSWAGAAVKTLREFAENSRMEFIGQAVEMKQGINEDIRRQCRELAQAMAARLDGADQ